MGKSTATAFAFLFSATLMSASASHAAETCLEQFIARPASNPHELKGSKNPLLAGGLTGIAESKAFT
ncbi:MAG: hypothetical protein V4760_19075, partial [Bdellovibrionota bacterium]